MGKGRHRLKHAGPNRNQARSRQKPANVSADAEHKASRKLVSRRSASFTQPKRAARGVLRTPRAKEYRVYGYGNRISGLIIKTEPNLRPKRCPDRRAVVVQRVRVPPHYTVMLDVKLVGLDNAQKRDGSWIVGDSGNGYLKGTGGLHQSLSPHKSFCEVRIDRCNP